MTAKEYHFIGIGGIGMSGLARMLLEKGQTVSGSDLGKSAITDELQKAGATIYFGQRKEHVNQRAIVIYSTDIRHDNPEFAQAKALGCTMLHRSDLLRDFMQPYDALLVAGTHGKTTTSALLTHVFQVANKKPSFAVGGMLQGQSRNACFSEGRYFIAEADESDKTFLKYPAKAQIVTNIGIDHIAHYGTWNALVEAFQAFMQKVADPSLLFYCQDCPTLKALQISGTSYGFTSGCMLQGSHFRQTGFGIVYDVTYNNRVYKDVAVSITGEHNACNSLAVFGLSIALGLDEQAVRLGLASFHGVKRRLEKKGNIVTVDVFDDYAHHPTEIRATLRALRLAVGKRRIIAIYQPHRYSRMQYLLDQFVHVFDDADTAVITDLYTANEAPIAGVSSDSIFEKIKALYPLKARFIPRVSLVDDVYACLLPDDVVITLGAGDITKVGIELCQKN